MNVSSWLKRIATSSSVARLDYELILAHALGKERVFLYAHPEYELSETEEKNADKMLARRAQHEALAYILGYKEFYGRRFEVTPDVLIPRPESEEIINLAKELKPHKILDVGTGSGCLAITMSLECSDAEVVAVDISPKALKIAQKNAKNLGAEVAFLGSDLLSAVKNDHFDLIVANLPYVDREWEWLSPELKFEPDLALYAEDGGLAVIKRLILATKQNLSEKGSLILESDLSQHEAIRGFAEQNSALRLEKESGLIQVFA
jgi:release factor glutamine methyltransferase